MQGQSQFAGEKEEDRKVWFTYHLSALKTTREAVALNSKLQVRSEKTDEGLACVRNSLPSCFSKSLVAIVMCVFVIEYRVKQIAQLKRIWNTKNSYIGKNEKEVKVSKCGKKKKLKKKKFKNLSLYEKWLNIVKFSGKPLKPNFQKLVRELNKWIEIRNDIAHAKWEKIRDSKISPEGALDCYDDITKAMFGLNTVLDYDIKQNNDRDCKDMLLRKENISP